MLTTGTTTTEAAAPPLRPRARRAGYGGRTSSLKGRSRDRYRDGLRPPLTPETSTPPNRRTARAGPAPAPLARDAQDPNKPQDHHNRVSTVSGDCRGHVVENLWNKTHTMRNLATHNRLH
jgi:hypothetical protein